MTAPTTTHRAVLAKLPTETAFRVLERAAILAEACGTPWPEADATALVMERRQPSLLGVGT